MSINCGLCLDELKEAREYCVEGVRVVDLEGPRPIAGSVCTVDLAKHAFFVFTFKDLISKSLHPSFDTGCYTQESVNLGASIQDFIQGNRYECEGLRAYPQWVPPYREQYRKCIIASNTLQTNFIRSNGFVIVRGKVVAKPLHAPGRDDLGYTRRGIAGRYSCLLVTDTTARIVTTQVNDPRGSTTDPELPPGSFGIASPRLVSGGSVCSIERADPPFRDEQGRLNGDWVDWPPESTATSFTAFGVDQSGKQLLMASVFEGEWGVDHPQGKGITPRAMGQLLLRYGAHDAILGGGAADTQQFIHGRLPRFRNAPVRPKSALASRGEVEGVRGLGAIAGVIPRRWL